MSIPFWTDRSLGHLIATKFLKDEMHFLQDENIESDFTISCKSAMAGIIARITRSNRERLEKKKLEINVGKCNYNLQPFDDHFDPKVRLL